MIRSDPFVPRRGWGNPHLQTTRSRLRPAKIALPDARQILVDLDDGSGDRLSVLLHESDRDSDKPTVAIIHGLGGSSDSLYVRQTAKGLLAAGFPVARVDLRGSGQSGDHSTGMYHGGRTADIARVVTVLDRPVAVVGFSLGGNVTIKLLGERTPGVVAGAAISAPLDLGVSAEHVHHMARGFYERFLLRKLRAECLRPAARYTPEERAAILGAKTLVEFDDWVTAPRNGWRDAAEYYEVNSSAQYLRTVDQPLLVIHAEDDPMVPIGPYRSIDWAGLPTTELMLTRHGGHVGFYGKDPLPWFVPQVADFLARI